MKQIIECVPNFSEGRDMNIIKQITDVIERVDGVMLLDVDPGKDTNRTVVTFAGEPGPVMDAAVACVAKAKELIDMTKHCGAHPRMGATDVCPLVPVSNITMEECVELAKVLGKRINEATGIPVYLYGEAAQRKDRYNLPDIRKGEYEALEEKLKDPDFAPDFGEPVFLPKSGATAVGARAFMLAYNINLNTRDLKAAQDIAMTIRSSGRAKRDAKGQIVKDKNGVTVKVPGKLKFCQAGGWYIEEYGYAQITMNLHRFDITGLHTAFDTVVKEAEKKGLRVTGSELIGLAPLQAMLDAGEHYLKLQGTSTACPEKEIIYCAVRSLGLADTSPFDPQKRIVEYALKNEKGQLKHLSVNDFTDLLSSNAPAPGGGSVAALNAALAAGLAAMVANLTFENMNYENVREDMENAGRYAQRLKMRALSLIDEDTAAFNAWMQALRLPKKSDDEKARRDAVVQRAVLSAVNIPLDTLKLCPDILKTAEFVLKKGNQNALSDATVGVRQTQAAAWGAYYNILINLPSLDDPKKRESILKTAKETMDAVESKAAKLTLFAEEKLTHAIG
ncbi:MAG: glutamate formimidoyltransferase [Candidatus Marinimicrobia bacterium]|nr:glutamate formimidoyltransferase [Candidatus Neomarinimicrobiota bacterium]MDD5710456.1 glutamate formimidoyltransferase [Candidatus Neomarinimicrobiota bacterium]